MTIGEGNDVDRFSGNFNWSSSARSVPPWKLIRPIYYGRMSNNARKENERAGGERSFAKSCQGVGEDPIEYR